MAAKQKAQAALTRKVGASLMDDMASANSNAGLAVVASIAKLQHEAALRVATLEDDLKEAKAHHRKISEVDLPEAMAEYGLKTLVTVDDLEVKLKDDVNVNITKEHQPAAYDWLMKHGFSGLIKAEISISFNREELNNAIKLADKIKKQGYEPLMSQSIHAQTLKAFVKEQLAIIPPDNTPPDKLFPSDLFGARPYTVATVKSRK